MIDIAHGTDFHRSRRAIPVGGVLYVLEWRSSAEERDGDGVSPRQSRAASLSPAAFVSCACVRKATTLGSRCSAGVFLFPVRENNGLRLE